MKKLEFVKFACAITVDGKAITSAQSKDYDLVKEGPEFCIKALYRGKKETYTAITNVSEWRYLDDEASKLTSPHKGKPAPSKSSP